MPAERPIFCQEANCPLFSKRCKLNEYVGSNWISPTGRKKERLRLTRLAETDPKAVMSLCSEKGFGYGESGNN